MENKIPDEIRVNERPKDKYLEFEEAIRENFNIIASDLNTKLFLTKAEGLWVYNNIERKEK